MIHHELTLFSKKNKLLIFKNSHLYTRFLPGGQKSKGFNIEWLILQAVLYNIWIENKFWKFLNRGRMSNNWTGFAEGNG